MGARLNDPVWLKAHLLQRDLRLAIPLIVIAGPIREEILFRAPLVMLFTSLSSWAWLGIGVSSVVFGLFHLSNKGKLISINDVLLLHEDEPEKTTSELVEQIKNQNEESGDDRRTVLAQTCFASLAGLGYGGAGVYYQSVYASVIVHSMWNLLAPTLLWFVFMICSIVWDTIYYHFFYKFRLKRRRVKRMNRGFWD